VPGSTTEDALRGFGTRHSAIELWWFAVVPAGIVEKSADPDTGSEVYV
jgi:hypothetical protein